MLARAHEWCLSARRAAAVRGRGRVRGQRARQLAQHELAAFAVFMRLAQRRPFRRPAALLSARRARRLRRSRHHAGRSGWACAPHGRDVRARRSARWRSARRRSTASSTLISRQPRSLPATLAELFHACHSPPAAAPISMPVPRLRPALNRFTAAPPWRRRPRPCPAAGPCPQRLRMEQVHAPALALQRQRIGVDIGRPEVVQRQQRGDAGLFALARQRAQAFGRRRQRVGVIGLDRRSAAVDQQVGQQLEGGGAALLALPRERVGQARQRGGVAVQQHGESGRTAAARHPARAPPCRIPPPRAAPAGPAPRASRRRDAAAR